MPWRVLWLLLVLLTAVLSALPAGAGPVPAKTAVLEAPGEGEISVAEFLQLLRERPPGFLLVDVRPAPAYARGHLPGAVNISEDTVWEHLAELGKATSVVFYCQEGERSAEAHFACADAGLTRTRYLNATLDIRADGSFDIE